MKHIDVAPQAMTIALLFFTAACAHVPSEPLQRLPLGVPLHGRVLYPDGGPASGATVRAETVCKDSTVHFVDEAVASTDGSFEIPSFDPFCGQVRFSAEFRAAYWLRTGEEVFYPGPNGSTPEIDLATVTHPDPVTVQLGARGGEVELKVWDLATDRYIHAGLNIGRPTAERKWGGAMSIATGEDGSPHTLFLPVGRYTVSLLYYACGTKTYFASTIPEDSFEVAPTERTTKTLTVNTFELSARSSYDNPRGEPCRP